jgi:predicted PurR-regulated permease PerM
MRWFKKEPPPKKPWFKNASIITPVIAAIIFSLVGVVYNSLAEELKQKVDNKTLQLMIEKDRDQLNQLKELNERQEKAIEQNQEAIRKLLTDKQVQEALKEMGKDDANKVVKDVINPSKEEVYITKEIFEFYMGLPDDQKRTFRNLHPEYKALPPS